MSREGSQRSYDASEIDAVAIYCPDNDKVYIIGVEDIASTTGHLRLEPAKNGQVKNIRFADKYELVRE